MDEEDIHQVLGAGEVIAEYPDDVPFLLELSVEGAKPALIAAP
ncbi:MAG: hypothetical protein ACRDJF_04540 [Actinomycetota bacterium]